jgi:thiol-disulfide isomerase/thioredoxin
LNFIALISMTSFRSPFTFLLLLAGLLLPAVAQAQLAKGELFPVAKAESLEGAFPEHSGKVTVVDFWASWCAPCKASFPALEQMNKTYASRGVVFVGVSVDERSSDYSSFLQKRPVSFATLRDKDKVLASGAKVPSMPTTYVLGRDGRVLAILAGYHGEKTEQALKSALDAALSQ